MSKHEARAEEFLALNAKSPRLALCLGLARSPGFIAAILSITLAVAGVPQKSIEIVRAETERLLSY